MKKLYMCEAELMDETCPQYTFFIKARNDMEAFEIATSIAEEDYNDIADVIVYEIESLEELEKYCL